MCFTFSIIYDILIQEKTQTSLTERGFYMNVYENDLNITCLSLQVGETDREKRIVWSHNSRRKGGRVIYAKAEDYDRDGDFTEENSTVVEALAQINRAYDDRLSCKARLYGLEFDTEYVYSVGDG